MAELTSEPFSSPGPKSGTEAGSKLCKSGPSTDSAGTSPLNPYGPTPEEFCLGSIVYVRYKDHVLYKNVIQPLTEAVERETVGWISKQTDEIMLIEHDRTIPNIQIPRGQGSGVIILKSCIVEMRQLLLQKSSKWILNSPNAKGKDEFALQPKKRKTQRKGMAT